MSAGMLGAAIVGLLKADHAQPGRRVYRELGNACSLRDDTRCRYLESTDIFCEAWCHQDTSVDLVPACLPILCQD